MERVQLPEVTMSKPMGFDFSLLFLRFMYVGWDAIGDYTPKEGTPLHI